MIHSKSILTFDLQFTLSCHTYNYKIHCLCRYLGISITYTQNSYILKKLAIVFNKDCKKKFFHLYRAFFYCSIMNGAWNNAYTTPEHLVFLLFALSLLCCLLFIVNLISCLSFIKTHLWPRPVSYEVPTTKEKTLF